MSDTSVDLAKNLLTDYTQRMNWYLLGFIIISALVQILLNWLLSKKIEKYKNELSINEIKFSRHSEMQIECIKNLYDLLVTFHFGYLNLVSQENYAHNTFKANANLIFKAHDKLIVFGHRNRILITDEISTQFRIVNTHYTIVKNLCKDELTHISEFEDINSSNDVQYLYGSEDNEKEEIKTRVNRLNKNKECDKLSAEICKMREIIESYFKKLVG